MKLEKKNYLQQIVSEMLAEQKRNSKKIGK